METLRDTIGNFERALEMAAKGYWLIPCHRSTKIAAVKWKRFQDKPPTAAEYERWFSEECNVAVVTGNGLVVVDVDDPSLLEEVIRHCGDTPTKIRTPGGGTHLWYGMRNGIHYGGKVKIRGKGIDMRCEGNYAMCLWSVNEEDVPYETLGEVLPMKELPLLKVSWLRERKRRRKIIVPDGRPLSPVSEEVRSIRSYIQAIPSVMGQNGNKGLMRVCYLLAERFDFDSALYELENWNREVPVPEWSEVELVRALTSAFRHKLKERMG